MAISTEIILTLKQLKGVGNKTIQKIADQIDFPLTSVNQLSDVLKSRKEKKLQEITLTDLENANKIALQIISECQNEGVGVISIYEDVYPGILRSCTDEKGNLDPPMVLYYRGNLEALKRPGVAVIGTREPTPNGIKAGKHFSAELAKRGYNIVSGLAVGCDTTGHQGALAAGGVTTAFLANGLDWESIYPKENLELAQEIVAKGGILLSEYPVGQSCDRYGLVARDRLQAGLSYATIVIQTGERGGTMHAVNATVNSGKPLFAVEYKKEEDTSNEKVQGNIKLVQEGKAHPLTSTSIEDALSIMDKSRDKLKIKVQQQTLF